MLEKFKSFELNKEQQKHVKGSALIPNKAACVNSISLGGFGMIFRPLALIGELIHC